MMPPMKLKLNIKLIEAEMERQGLNRKDLCRIWKLSRTAMYYVWDEKPASYAVRFGKLFNRPAKDLIV